MLGRKGKYSLSPIVLPTQEASGNSSHSSNQNVSATTRRSFLLPFVIHGNVQMVPTSDVFEVGECCDSCGLNAIYIMYFMMCITTRRALVRTSLWCENPSSRIILFGGITSSSLSFCRCTPFHPFSCIVVFHKVVCHMWISGCHSDDSSYNGLLMTAKSFPPKKHWK